MKNQLYHQAYQLVMKIDIELERYEDDERPTDKRYNKLRRMFDRAECRMYRRQRLSNAATA